MDNGKHFSPSNGQQPVSPKPVVPATRRARHGKTTGHSRLSSSNAENLSSSPNPRRPRRSGGWRSAATAAFASILVVAGIAGVIAWTVAQDSLTNAFEIGTVVPVIDEDFNPQPDSAGRVIKKDVKAKNDGKADIYVRASVNIYWVDSAGNQLWNAPESPSDYSVTYSSDSGWSSGDDGYYYWTSKISRGGETGNLIDSISQDAGQIEADKEAGRRLVVDIDIQGIQADPADAVTEAWKGVTVEEDGTLSIGGGE